MVKSAEKKIEPKRVALPRKTAPSSVDAQSSAERMLGLLDLFTPSAPIRPVADLVNYLGTSRSTSYRYIKALNAAGLIEAIADGRYALGPRIIELDRQIRTTDPLFKSGGPVLLALVGSTGLSALLCALNRDSVMCIREELAPASPARMFSRGQRRPLFAGAASKAILPYLPPHQLRSIFDHHARTIAQAGLGTDWKSFRESLAAIRRDGYVMSHGEFNPGVFGIAAPVLNPEGLVVGSVGIAGSEENFDRKRVPAWCDAVVAGGKQLSERLANEGGEPVRPPRAFGSV
jgi:DNA-binding IclR family transcriptional regulator